jgi:hypothetical protein
MQQVELTEEFMPSDKLYALHALNDAASSCIGLILCYPKVYGSLRRSG